VSSQTRRASWNACQPLSLTLTLKPPSGAPLELTPYHLKKNRMMKKAIALMPMI